MATRIFACFLMLIIVFSCQVKDKNAEGKKLAQTYCGSCHQVPSPLELDKKTWLLGVLPEMGARLGIKSFQGYSYTVQNNPTVPPGFYPASAAMTDAEWEQIVNYFYTEAPDSLEGTYEPISTKLKRFLANTPAYPSPSPPVSCYVKIDPGNHAVYVAHGTELKLRTFDRDLFPLSEASTSNVVVDVAFGNLAKPGVRQGTLLNMGALDPRDVTHGSLQAITIGAKGLVTISPGPLIDSLQRPVNIQPADLNKDGREDYVVCGFGNYAGSLFWLKNTGNGRFEKNILRNKPGSIQAMVVDINHDALPDILALMAQGDEGVFLYEQKADGSFVERNLLRFSPSAGSIAIDLADFNGDGYPDLVYTSGDNADYSKVLKPYHGVYIYLNDGEWNFTQRYFFHINGCFKALARDYDQDGDMDIAAISYFPDFAKRPEESFVYLENNGNLDFSPFSFPQHSFGRWLTMDAGDLDGDGDIDIVLGNMSIGPTNITHHANWRQGPAFVVLENKLR